MASTLCAKCSTLILDHLWNNDVVFHENLQALIRSAEQGCAFCNLCWTLIQADWKPVNIERCLAASSPGSQISDPRIYLQGDWQPPDPVPSVPSRIYLSCGKMPMMVGDPTVDGLFCHLDLFAAPGLSSPARYSPATADFGARYITGENRNLDLLVSQVHSWVSFCQKYHKLCNNASRPSAPRTMPTRLIDVGDPSSTSPASSTTRIVLSSTLPTPQPYIALSYCWGPGPLTLSLTDATLPTFLTHLPATSPSPSAKTSPLNSLPQSHLDAIQLTRALGIRYLWIDALCITQGNRPDWERESKLMASVYGGAFLTIVAGRAASSHEGFIPNTHLLHNPHGAPVPLPCGPSPRSHRGPDLGAVYATIPRSALLGPVSTRGWCFQEGLLSNRSLVFGEQQVGFRCRVLSMWEDGLATFESKDGPHHLGGPMPGRDAAEVMRRWYGMLFHFTPRALTEPHDVFACVASIAMLVGRVVKSRYLAGLWEGDMVRGLMWRGRHGLHLGSYEPLRRPRASGFRTGEVKGGLVVRAPSWSWAAVVGPVIWEAAGVRKERAFVDRESVCVRPRNGERWTVQEGVGEADRLFMPRLELQVWGRMVEVRRAEMTLVEVKHMPKYDKFGMLLDAASGVVNGGRRSVLGFIASAYFDVDDEKDTEDLWCLLVVVGQGLLLAKDVDGKFRRVGRFLVAGDGWPENIKEVAVDLI
ncbi:heterokaryon incompatibility protein-domain-containing protein [Bombardia bombarda]|uniref:Heterokaryon incompatibility protein-domain-containing protein n=1 Tax=Bombardia bombarda TaxID=252184 RepID=A0AA40CAD8_9PEZI|nr:heterokaryon incompatibility protein-domain-containing protein [Bombardia bombarda]